LPASNSLVAKDRFPRVAGAVLDPQPRFSPLDDLAGLIEQMSKEPAL
jgi:hypothetical protein